jgi:hypothetical protein
MIAAYICQRYREVQIVAEEVRGSALIGAGSEELPELLRENLRRRVAYTNLQQKDTRACAIDRSVVTGTSVTGGRI